MSIELSIIIPHLSGVSLLRDCLLSIEENIDKTLSKEVIVIFNGSHDGSIRMCAKDFPWVRRIVNITNMGFNFANNQGIDISSGRYIMLLNNDTIVLPKSVELLINYIDSHGDVGMVGPRLIYPDGRVQMTCNRFPCIRQLVLNAIGSHHFFPRNRYLGGLNMQYWDYGETRCVDSISGACMLVRRDALCSVGLLDIRTPVAGDYDLCWRFWKCGYKVVFVHDAIIIHKLGQSSIKPIDKDAGKVVSTKLHNIQAIYNFFRDYKSERYAVLATIINQLEVLLRLPLNIVSFLFASREKRWIFRAEVLFCLFLLKTGVSYFRQNYSSHPFLSD